MADEKITQLASGTVKNTDVHIAVDTTDTSMAPSGTDKKYLWSALKTDMLATAFTVTANQLLISAGAGLAPTGDSGLTFASNILTAPTALLKTGLRLEDPGVGTNYVLLQAGTLSGNSTYTLPTALPLSNGQILSSTTAGVMSWVNDAGNVTGPGSSTDTAIVRWNGTSGLVIENSSILIDGSDNITGANSLAVGNLGLATNVISSTSVNADIQLDPNGTGIVSALSSIKTTASLIMKDSGSNTVSRAAPPSVTTSYRVFEAATIPTSGQIPVVAGVVGTDVSMTWTTVNATIITPANTTWTGIWASPQTANMEARETGNTVVLTIAPNSLAAATTAATVTNTTALPVGLRPANMQLFDVWVYDNGNTIKGQAVIGTSGFIVISLQKSGLNGIGGGYNFTGTGVSGWPEIVLTYSLT